MKSYSQLSWENSIQLDGLYTFNEALKACPDDYRLPTDNEQEWLIDNTEYSFDYEKKEGVFLFKDGFELRLPAMGYHHKNGNYFYQGCLGLYWSHYWRPSITNKYVWYMHFNYEYASVLAGSKDSALSVRCVPSNILTHILNGEK